MSTEPPLNFNSGRDKPLDLINARNRFHVGRRTTAQRRQRKDANFTGDTTEPEDRCFVKSLGHEPHPIMEHHANFLAYCAGFRNTMMCCIGSWGTSRSKANPSGSTSVRTSATLILWSGRIGRLGSSYGGGREAHGKENSRNLLYGRPSSQTRALSPRQLPTDDDYAVSIREYQSDQPSRQPPRPPPTLRFDIVRNKLT